MKTIEFIGEYIEAKRSGCSSCRGNRIDNGSFSGSKREFLPSGQFVTFRVTRPVEVSDEDANYLLTLTYDYKGSKHNKYKLVE